MALTQIYADKIRDELTAAVDTRKLAEAWAALHPKEFGAAKALTPALSQFLARAGKAVQGALRRVLPGAWTEGAALGRLSAQASAKAAETGSAALGAVDWGSWHPGDPEAAYQVAGPGLRDLLASQEVSIKSIAASRLEELGDVLAEYVGSPETERPLTGPIPPVYSVDALEQRLKQVLDNPDRAYMVAHTEIARAASAAAVETYRDMGVGEVRVSTAGDARVCPVCEAAEKRGAVPTGTIAVPLHPLCRCALVAVQPPLRDLVPQQAPATPLGAEQWPLSRVGQLKSGNEPGLTVEQEYQRKVVQGKYSPNDFERAKRAGFAHPREHQADITAHIAQNGIINAAQVSAGALDEGFHRYAAARQLGQQTMPVKESA